MSDVELRKGFAEISVIRVSQLEKSRAVIEGFAVGVCSEEP